MPDSAYEMQERTENIHEAEEHSRGRTALLIAVLAILLSISSLSSEMVGRHVIDSNIHSSRLTAQLETKDVHRAVQELAVDEYDILLTADEKNLSPAGRSLVEQHRQKAMAAIASMKSDPASGAGIKELEAEEKKWDNMRDHAEEQLPNFELADILFELGIVLSSASIILKSKRILYLVGALALLATLLLCNGYLLFFHLPGH